MSYRSHGDGMIAALFQQKNFLFREVFAFFQSDFGKSLLPPPGSKMKSKSNSIYFLIAIFLLLFVQMAIHDRQDLIEIEHFLSAPAFERTHPEDLAAGDRNDFQKFKFLIADASAFQIFQKEDLSIQLPLQLIFSPISPEEQPLVLRC
jgi:hypothetical protein